MRDIAAPPPVRRPWLGDEDRGRRMGPGFYVLRLLLPTEPTRGRSSKLDEGNGREVSDWPNNRSNDTGINASL